MCGPGRGWPAPATSVTAGWTAPVGAPGNTREHPLPKNGCRGGGCLARLGGIRGATAPPSSPLLHMFLGPHHTLSSPGAVRRPEASSLATGGGHRGRASEGGRVLFGGCMAAGQCCPSLGLPGKHPGLGEGSVEWAPSQTCLEEAGLPKGCRPPSCLCPFLYKVNVRCKHLRPWALRVTEGQSERQRPTGAWPKSHHQ